jgi:hypothetical protein
MNKKNKDIALFIIAFFLSVIFLYIIFLFVPSDWVGLFWGCYIGVFIILVGVILKKPELVLSQIIILLIPDLIWDIDFFYRLITGIPLFGVNNYFFGNSSLVNRILSLQHLFTPILAIGALALMKVKRNYKILLVSFAEIFALFLLGFLLPAERGINCLPTPETCVLFQAPKFLPYPLVWFAISFSFIILSYCFLTLLPFIKKKDILKS